MPAWLLQEDFLDVWGMRAICQRETSNLVSCTAMTRWKPSSVGEGTWTFCIDGENSSMIVDSVFGWHRVTRLPGRGREKFTVTGRWVSPSSPIGVFGLCFYDPNTSAPSRCGSRVQNSSPPGMSSKTFCNTMGSPIRWARRWAPFRRSGCRVIEALYTRFFILRAWCIRTVDQPRSIQGPQWS